MNTVAPNRGSKMVPMALPLDNTRGVWSMWMVIATETTLFVCFYGAYFFLENNKNRWAYNKPPVEHWGWGMLALAAIGCVTIRLGQVAVTKGNELRARIMLGITLFTAIGFLVLEGFDYVGHWATLTPYSNSYGSIFYVIESFDALHVIVACLIFAFVLALPTYTKPRRAPYRPYRVAEIYWYFVTGIWASIFFLLYIMPNLRIYGF